MMENNNELQWQDLVVYNGNQKQICFTISQSDDVGTSSSSSNFRLATDQLGYFHPNKKLKSSVLADPMKKSRSLSVHVQTPCCQVEGCNIDLKGAKEYHRRHKICESHSKSPRVIVKGMERRFCQQCSRFHELSEFDDKKRSCRRRLSDHNARRRRLNVETIHLHPPKPSSFYDIIQMQQNGLLNRLPFSQPEHHDGRFICFSNNEIHNSVCNIQMDSTTSVMDQCLHVPLTSNYMRERDLLDASSLLSANSWSMNHSQATTMDSLFNGNAGFSTMH